VPLNQRSILMLAVCGSMFALLGYMELDHEVEYIGPENALVTNHFTGEVRNCNTRGYGDWSCWPVEIEPRSGVLALIPFWPARENLGEKLHLSETWAEDTPFKETPLYSDLISNGVIGIVMLAMGIFIMRIRDDEEGGDGSGGGSDGGGFSGE